MTFEVRQLNPLDLRELAEEVAEEHARPYLASVDFEQLRNGFVGLLDCEVVGCGGLSPIYGVGSIRAVAWLLMLPRAQRVILPIMRTLKREIEHSPYRRIEAHCDAGSSNANRLCELLGFHLEAEGLLKWFPSGAAANQWSIIK